MFTKKTTNIDTTALETELAERVKDLTDARASFRRQRERIDDLGALFAEQPNSVALASQLHEAERKAEELRTFVEKAHDAMKAIGRKLDLARTKPLREANAAKLNAAADALERAMPAARLAIAQLVEALDGASFPDIALATPGPTLFGTMVHNCGGALCGPDGLNFAQALRAYAQALLDGTVGAGLRESIAEQQAVLRKAS